MKLPNRDRAVVEQKKVVEYLLNPEHPDNGGKADFFAQLGFTSAEWTILGEALRLLATDSEVTISVESTHGTKYIVDGRIENPSHKTALVRSVWIVDRGETFARLVTAYPHEKIKP